MESEITVSVEVINDHGDLKMVWEAYPKDKHVSSAFDYINTSLNETHHPIYILVDLQSDPQIPLTTTIREVMSGPFRHKNLKKWLVVGRNRRAQVVARVMDTISKDSTILWFDTENEALDKLNELIAQSG